MPGCVEGPLGPWAEGFVAWLADRGYTSATAADQLRRMGWLSSWLAGQGLTGDAVTGSTVVEFAALMRAAGHRGVTPGRMAAMLAYLRGVGAVPPAITSSADATTRQQQLASYRAYLAEDRGLAPDTVQERLYVAGVFLDELGDGFVDHLTPQRVLEIVTSWGPLTRSRISPLRSFLRYLYAAGRTGGDLAMVIPAVRRRETAHRPVRLDAAEAAAVLHGVTRSGETGARNYAVLLLLARLGLRACEVCRLTLDDVHWRSGTLMIHRKGGRDEQLPLPVDIGHALADYLLVRPPVSGTRAVFVTVMAPRRALTRQGVGGLVRTACTAVGRPAGPHQFRHLLGGSLSRAGVSPADIAQVLGHHDLAVTAIYIDPGHEQMADLIRRWPLADPVGPR